MSDSIDIDLHAQDAIAVLPATALPQLAEALEPCVNPLRVGVLVEYR